MYSNDDLKVLDLEEDLADPLDELPTVEDEVAAKPDPEAMLPLLDAADIQQRMLAARAFCDVQDDRAIPKLIALLSDPCPLVRVSAAYALGRNPSPEAVESLVDRYQQDWNGYVRKGVVWALGNCRDRRSLNTLTEAVKTDISAVRLWAASSLAQMATLGYDVIVAAVPPLIEGLRRDPVAAIRSNCAWALGELCREMPSNVVYATAIDALIEAFAEDEDSGVREDAKAAMLKVGDARGLQVIETLEQEDWF
ncbi:MULTISPECIES: HEAT repeat domain-containing protein [Leptolyngbya]|jgi:HEAT repeat protein|uniref:PBS lyase HEAT-like repeat protein n=2 Tax=Leptolyngbya boryana TaxID=1184 RepID=A0A1Z4JLA3_LEPBY|nr:MULTISPECIES: HEAT repeat domain-containing protein [Leptolyngbya]BAY57496.1 PBS lyase HEAT-like repeat protein [Leptolyngbya boryana NIES-2135]MBD1859217.1 HEAT repeat domain-containing protein [Leptolyngbya sp. FACHB-1624]MBD2368568.1 HEAT repeat domain-containing protein [Leptolyngbya sp. FACHB-161]MBD2375171.1 HEAT repeat domain-containing protein [Leptolyngbya sp. FACHB-238]MBD2399590.1 HEAT repeat domain-containing protein [Leptolyngbya sp. FACHB-239]